MAWVDTLVQFAEHGIHQARNAYSAMVMMPFLANISFHPLIKSLKKDWNVSTPKYAAFYDPLPVLLKLIEEPLNRSDIKQVRERLILVWRFFHLF